MEKEQFRTLVTAVLQGINLHSESAVELLMMTAAQESHLGHYIKQVKGPALGVMQMEPNTFKDITNNYLKYRPYVKDDITNFCNLKVWDKSALVYNLAFSIALARVHYYRVSEALPVKDNLLALAAYYKKYYNTYKGAATISEVIFNHKKYVL